MKIVNCEHGKWDAFVERSPQGTVFSKSCFLRSYGGTIQHLLCLHGDDVYGGFAFVESEEGIGVMPYCSYSGILLKDLDGLKPYRANQIQFSVMEAFAEYLFSRYQKVALTNHWGITDVRPFDWLNYQHRQNGCFNIAVRYTSLLDTSDPADTSGYQMQKKQHLKESYKYELTTRESDDIEIMANLYLKTMERQSILVPPEHRQYLHNICRSLIDNRAGKLLVTFAGNRPASACFMGIDRFRAYYIYGASDPEMRDTQSNTRNLYDTFVYLNKTASVKEVDLLGINSPDRGAYKLTFGGTVVPYFQITKVGGHQPTVL